MDWTDVEKKFSRPPPTPMVTTDEDIVLLHETSLKSISGFGPTTKAGSPLHLKTRSWPFLSTLLFYFSSAIDWKFL